MLLEVKGVHVQYGQVRAVNGVDIHIDEGEIVSVIGANGAGKSSLLSCVLGLAPVTKGTIELRGANIRSWTPPRRVRAGVALVPEGRRILVSLTVEDNLLVGGCNRSDREGITNDLAMIYERFPNIAARKHFPASVLSGGEQQMLAIGRAIMARPQLMLLDEPSLGLSPIFVKEIFRVIAELNKKGIAILLVEQNTRLALNCSTRSYILNLGSVVKSGRSCDLIDSDDLLTSVLASNHLQTADTRIVSNSEERRRVEL